MKTVTQSSTGNASKRITMVIPFLLYYSVTNATCTGIWDHTTVYAIHITPWVGLTFTRHR